MTSTMGNASADVVSRSLDLATPLREAMLPYMAILAWTCLVSLPTLRFDDADDAFFVEVAHLWTQGHAPFVAAFDVKGLGFYAILALAEQAIGASLLTMKIVEALFLAIGAAALYRIAAKYDRAAAVLAAALFPILTIISCDAAYAVMNAFLLVAFACAFSEASPRARALYAGLAVGVACTVKQTCAIDGLALMYILGSRDRKASLASFIVAAPLAPLAFVAGYALSGHLGDLTRDFVVTALNRESIVPWSAVFGHFVEWMTPFAVVAVVAPLALLQRQRISAAVPMRALFVWLAIEGIGLVAQRGGYRTSMAPLIAPMLLIAALFISATYAVEGRVKQRAALSIFGLFVVCGAMLGYGATILRKMTIIDTDGLRQIAGVVEATRPRGDDRLFVVNGRVWPNIALNLPPPTPFFHFEHVMCEFPGAGLPALVANFEARPRYVVFETPNRRLTCEPEAFAREIGSALAADYRLVSTVRSELSNYQIFEIARP